MGAKKRKKSNKGLIIGLCVGAGVLLLLLLLAGVGLILWLAFGREEAKVAQVNKDDPLKAVLPPEAFKPVAQPPKKGLGGPARVLDITEVRQLMKQLGLAYHTFESDRNAAPKNLKELSPYYENSARITDLLQKGQVVFLYGVRPQQMTSGTSNTILAYEAVQDGNGVRVVLMGDGSVQELDEASFQKAPKAPGNPNPK
jgi:hypothetical protein